MNQELILRAYEAFGDKTPQTYDCGSLCNAACCHCETDVQGGVDLLPGEEEIVKGVDWAEIAHDEMMDAPMIMCKAFCEREKRPFLCRIFPLCPAMGKSGKWTVKMDARARALCPLSASGLNGLDPDFVKAAVKAVRIIAEDPEGEKFLQKWADIEAEFRKPLW